LALLARRKNVKTIYCFVRASTPTAAEQRVQSTLASKKLGPFTAEESGKIVCLPADLSKSDFGLDDHILSTIMNSLTAVIHSAWAVNFNLGVSSFESHHIRGTYNLLNACLQTRTVNPARLYFCSSISAAAGTPLPAVVPETYISELAYAQNMGYARSKLVTENIVKAAMEKTGMCARVLRLGQIVGDTQHGLWNATEAIPLMIQSASTIGALPELDEVSRLIIAPPILKENHSLTNLDSFLDASGRSSPGRPRILVAQQYIVFRSRCGAKLYCLSRPKYTFISLDKGFTSRLTVRRSEI
jgi:thioester reductase-like protein